MASAAVVFQGFAFGLGMLLNAAAMVAFVLSPGLLATRLNKWITVLVALNFSWSAERIVIFILMLANIAYQVNVSAVFTTLLVMAIFFVNVGLAADRYFTLQPTWRSYFFVFITFLAGAVFGCILWAFSTAPSSDSLHPSEILQLKVWVSAVSVAFFSATFLTSFFYWLTYRVTSQRLSQNPFILMSISERVSSGSSGVGITGGDTSNNELFTLQTRVEQQLFLQCVLLSATILICYLPFHIYDILYVVAESRSTFSNDHAFFRNTGTSLLSLDVVITPLLVFYFKQDLREMMRFR
ncbi:hypothetical protein HDU83_008099 [Entophlyctis luteolus]|nr:hypothetical protein HDU83_008099 [Entophlyctis luteolus]